MTSRRAAVYARQSLDKSGEGLAVSRQLEDCRDLLTRKGWTSAGEYVDNDVSATSGKARPEYRRMLEAVEAGRVDTIVSWAPDRLARRPRDLEDLLDLVEGRGVNLATVSGDVDLSTSYGRATARIFGAIARQEVEQKGARQARANLQRAQDGRTAWTRRPFGYQKVDGEIVVVEAEAAEIRKAADAVLTGATLTSIVGDLTARGVTTSTGAPFSLPTIKRVLLNPRVSGQAVYRGAPTGEGRWQAILEPDVQDRLDRILRDPGRRTAMSTVRKYLLSGLVLCGKCGEVMYASPMGKRGGYWMVYRCRTAHNARRMDLVDDLVVSVVLARLSLPDAASLLEPAGPDAEVLQDRAVDLRKQLDDLAGLLAEKVLTVAGVRKASRALQDELEDVERQRLHTSSSSALTTLIGAAEVEQAWQALTLDAQREVVRTLLTATILPAGKGHRFTPEQVEITWSTT